MAIKKEIRDQLISIFGSAATLTRRKKELQQSHGPMTADEAGYVLAHLRGIDLNSHLPISVLDRVRALVPRGLPIPASAPAKAISVQKKASYPPYPLLGKREVSRAYKLGAEVYPILFVLENSIRKYIEIKLSVHGDDWWDTQVDPDVKNSVTRIIRIEQRYPYRDRRGDHPLLYTNFLDLKKIVLFNEVEFLNEIIDMQWFEVHMDEVYMVRNNIAHCVPISPDDINRLKLFHRDWARLMDAAGI